MKQELERVDNRISMKEHASPSYSKVSKLVRIFCQLLGLASFALMVVFDIQSSSAGVKLWNQRSSIVELRLVVIPSRCVSTLRLDKQRIQDSLISGIQGVVSTLKTPFDNIVASTLGDSAELIKSAKNSQPYLNFKASTSGITTIPGTSINIMDSIDEIVSYLAAHKLGGVGSITNLINTEIENSLNKSIKSDIHEVIPAFKMLDSAASIPTSLTMIVNPLGVCFVVVRTGDHPIVNYERVSCEKSLHYLDSSNVIYTTMMDLVNIFTSQLSSELLAEVDISGIKGSIQQLSFTYASPIFTTMYALIIGILSLLSLNVLLTLATCFSRLVTFSNIVNTVSLLLLLVFTLIVLFATVITGSSFRNSIYSGSDLYVATTALGYSVFYSIFSAILLSSLPIARKPYSGEKLGKNRFSSINAAF